MEIFLTIVALLLALHITLQIAANRTQSATSALSAEEALAVFLECFMPKLNHIQRGGYEISVKPRFKIHAPTLTVRATATATGSEVDVWVSNWRVHYIRYRLATIPLGKAHTFWALRKQIKFLRRLRAAGASTTTVGG